MMEIESKKKRKLSVDIILFFAVSLCIYGLYGLFFKEIFGYMTNKNIDVFSRSLFTAFMHFCQAGLAACIVILFRKEKIKDYGITKAELMHTALYSFVLVLGYIAIIVVRGMWRLYYPFRALSVCEELITAPIYQSIIGMIIFCISCGFFESFNIAVLSKKINERWPVKNIFLSPGPIVISILSYMGHSIMGINGWIGYLPLLFLVYGLLVVYEKTKNMWGLIGAFCLIWYTL